MNPVPHQQHQTLPRPAAPMMMMPPPQQAHVPVAAAPAAPQLPEGWTQHQDASGRTYYHNANTKVSQYEVPKNWRSYQDPTSGKTYYSDGVTTTWDRPKELGELPKEPEAPSDEPPPRKKPKVEVEFESKSEAIAAFKGLLLAKDVDPTMKWPDVTKLCSKDSRWDACEVALALGERKQALAEYQTKRSKELREEERKEKQRAKQMFTQMLAELVTPSDCRQPEWETMRRRLSQDERFHALAEEELRESLFWDWCQDARQREERHQRQLYKENQEKFASLLQDKGIALGQSWGSFLDRLSERDRADPRYMVSDATTDADRRAFFEDYQAELRRTEDEKRENQRTEEKRLKGDYRNKLRALASEGKISLSTKWKGVEEWLAQEPEAKAVANLGEDMPSSIFADFVDVWNDAYMVDRAILLQIVKPQANREIVVTSETAFADFEKSLKLELKEYPKLDPEVKRILGDTTLLSSARILFDELQRTSLGLGVVLSRRKNGSRRRADSSDDEGEIVESATT